MKTRLVRIGNSYGVRLPGTLLQKAGIRDQVEVTMCDRALVIRSADQPRAGWDAAVQLLVKRGEDCLLLDDSVMRFDDEEWKW